MELHDKFGRLSLAQITPEMARELEADAQQSLLLLIDANASNIAAQQRKSAATLRLNKAMVAEDAALAAHIEANPAPTAIEARRAAIRAFNGEEPEEKSKSHAKHAKAGPRQAYQKAQSETEDARIELNAATSQAQQMEAIENEALANFLSLLPQPTQDEVFRAHIKRGQDEKLARVSQGLPAVEPKKITARSPIDIAAANRPRNAAHSPTGTPLRSSTVRRSV